MNVTQTFFIALCMRVRTTNFMNQSYIGDIREEKKDCVPTKIEMILFLSRFLFGDSIQSICKNKTRFNPCFLAKDSLLSLLSCRSVQLCILHVHLNDDDYYIPFEKDLQLEFDIYVLQSHFWNEILKLSRPIHNSNWNLFTTNSLISHKNQF